MTYLKVISDRISQELKAFLGLSDFQVEQDLVQHHVIDSFEIENLITFIRDFYHIEVFMEDLHRDHFRTILSISDFIFQRIDAQLSTGNVNLDTLIVQRNSLFRDALCILDKRANVFYTFDDIDKHTKKIVAYLRNRGIGIGDRIGILMCNTMPSILLYLSTIRMGAIAVPLDPYITQSELRYIVSHCDMRVLSSHSDRIEDLMQVQDYLSNIQELICLDFISNDRIPTFEAILSSTTILPPEQNYFHIPPDTPAVIMYTSGTTGSPKGVTLSHRNLIVNSYSIGKRLELGGQRLLSVLAMHHTNGQIINLLSPFILGGEVVLDETFNIFSISSFWKTIEDYKINIVDVVPTILIMLLKFHALEQYKTEYLKFIICGAAPLQVEIQAEFEARYNCKIIQEYGLTETTCVSALDTLNERKVGSIGRPLSCNEIKIVDSDNGMELPIGEVGEIAVRGSNVMLGYYKIPNEDTEVIRDGWLYTGDIGWLDNDGYLFIHGRKKNIILKGGVTIYPNDIDNVLVRHPDILECITVPVPDEVYGDEISSFVVLKAPHDPKIDEASIIKFCGQYLSHFNCPKYIQFVSSLPRTASGKIKLSEIINSNYLNMNKKGFSSGQEKD